MKALLRRVGDKWCGKIAPFLLHSFSMHMKQTVSNKEGPWVPIWNPLPPGLKERFQELHSEEQKPAKYDNKSFGRRPLGTSNACLPAVMRLKFVLGPYHLFPFQTLLSSGLSEQKLLG